MIARCYEGAGDTDTAIEAVNEALALDKNRCENLQLLACTYWHRRDYASSKDYVQRALPAIRRVEEGAREDLTDPTRILRSGLIGRGNI